MCKYTCSYMIRICAHVPIHIHMPRLDTCTHIYTYVTHKHAYIYAHTFTYQTHIHMHYTHTHTCMHAHTYTLIHTYILTDIHPHIHTTSTRPSGSHLHPRCAGEKTQMGTKPSPGAAGRGRGSRVLRRTQMPPVGPAGSRVWIASRA